MPRTGLEPARLSTLAPETSASTIPPPGHLQITAFERKTRLELATPALTSNAASLSFWGKVVLYQLSHFRVCFTNSAHFGLHPLRERKLSLSPVRKFHKTYINKKRQLIAVLKSGKRGSNSRPQPWQGCALPTELFPRLLRLLILVYCEGDETRTHTTQRSLPPQSSASTNSATPP